VMILAALNGGDDSKKDRALKANGQTAVGVVKGPGDADRPKVADAGQKKDKKDKPDVPERPAPLPQLVAFPKLTLPARGAADLQVKVDRQGYAGPIKVQ